MRTFKTDISNIEVPKQFTYPFFYQPHDLCKIAAKEIETEILQSHTNTKLLEGKMFGVLVVSNQNGKIGYLAGFSGLWNQKSTAKGFVPPIYDITQPSSYFKKKENEISLINQKIDALKCDEIFQTKIKQLEKLKLQQSQQLTQLKLTFDEHKRLRDEKRKSILSEQENKQLIRESQFEKAELKRQKKQFDINIQNLEQEIDVFSQQIKDLQSLRKKMSFNLQQWIFDQFKIQNANGETISISNLFAIHYNDDNQLPPAGAGDCAGPKLLQYAYNQNYKPICMAEFWIGKNSSDNIRKHGNFYPACQNKCKPILSFMMKGLDVEPNPLLSSNADIKIIHEDDEILVVDKPAGLQTVDGKENVISLEKIIRERYNLFDVPLIVHRLDMHTSGIVVMAKTKAMHKYLQQQFAEQKVKKTYIAILEGKINQTKGTIDLPLIADIENRPYQKVDFKKGKKAVTTFQVIDENENRSIVKFCPITGRTHQLRVHAAHPMGLNCAILGDRLYGTLPADRLYLHAQEIEIFSKQNKKMIFQSKKTFNDF